MTKNFSIAALMSVMTGLHLAEKLSEVFDLVEFLASDHAFTGDKLDFDKLQAVTEIQLCGQFKKLYDQEMRIAQGQLCLALKSVNRKGRPLLISQWLRYQSVRMGWDINEPVTVSNPSK